MRKLILAALVLAQSMVTLLHVHGGKRASGQITLYATEQAFSGLPFIKDIAAHFSGHDQFLHVLSADR